MQRIEPRGPRNTLCFIPSLVPLKDVIDEVIETKNFDRVTARYPITYDEVFEAMEVYVDNARWPRDDNILVLEDIHKAYLPDADVVVSQISEMVFLGILNYSHHKHSMGEFLHQNDGDLDTLFTDGLYVIIKEICEDYLYNSSNVMDSSDLHNIVFDSFVNAYSGDFVNDMQLIYEYLESNFEDRVGHNDQS